MLSFSHLSKILCFCATLQMGCSFMPFGSITSLLEEPSLEELSLLEKLSFEVQQLKENNKELFGMKIQRLQQNQDSMENALSVKVSQLQKLEQKVRHLESKLEVQQKQDPSSSASQNVVHFDLEEPGTPLKKQHVATTQEKRLFRTCQELLQADRSLSSGMYWIDPDGHGFEDPIHVHCDMRTGKTSVPHDGEHSTNVGHCAAPGCYSTKIKYSASMRQMDALAELSSECHQSIQYDCNLAPFEINGVAQSWWNDRNGVAQYFWSGSNNSTHTCQCGIDKNCVELYHKCNCDSAVPVPLNDTGVITDKKYLPITGLNFGRTQFTVSSGVHTLGRFECTGQPSLSEMPKSCSDLWRIGHALNGIYSVSGSDYVETVYCDFAKQPHEQGFQKWIGYSEVKSSPVHFYVQRNTPRNVRGRIPFELTKLNIGGAMNASSGIFTAPRSGIYSFAFSGIGNYPTPSAGAVADAKVSSGFGGLVSVLHIGLTLNGSTVSSGGMFFPNTVAIHSSLMLKAGDQVWVSITSVSNSVLFDKDSEGFQYTHFTGHLLQEKVTSSLN